MTAIVAALRADGYGLIVLNVDERNIGTRSLYDMLGFEAHCQFVEGCANIGRDLDAADRNGWERTEVSA